MKKLLVVIDYQKDFVDGALGFDKASNLENGIYDKITKYLNDGNKVLFTYDTHDGNYLESREGKSLPIIHCIKDTSGHSLYGKLNNFIENENILHLNKYGFGISPKDMIKISKELGEDIELIEIIGIVTNICVISNFVMFQSQYRNAEIIIDASLCASFNDELHNKTLDVIEGLQGKIINREK